MRATLAAAAVAVTLAAPAHALDISAIYVFGDSNWDTGNVYAALGGDPNGRASNGRLASEYASETLGVPLTTYAYGGATSGLYNIITDPRVRETGVLNQLEMYRSDLAGTSADPRALYILGAGGNDLRGTDRSDTDLLDARIHEVASNLETAAETLASLGAEYIMVMPRFPRDDLGSDDNANGQDLNAAIRAMVAETDDELGALVQYFDAYSVIEDMMLDPSAYGIVNTTDACTDNPACVDDLSVAAGYIQWDGLHKTTRTHEVLAQALVAQVRATPVPVPAAGALAILGAGVFGGLAAARRRRMAA